MRITFLTHYPGHGGSTTLVSQLTGYFQSQNHEVSLLAGEDCPNPVLLNYSVVPAHRGGSWRARIQDYLNAVEATRPDVVYTVSGRDEYDVLRFLRCARVCHFSSLEQTFLVEYSVSDPAIGWLHRGGHSQHTGCVGHHTISPTIPLRDRGGALQDSALFFYGKRRGAFDGRKRQPLFGHLFCRTHGDCPKTHPLAAGDYSGMP